jgi:hypothetical protein
MDSKVVFTSFNLTGFFSTPVFLVTFAGYCLVLPYGGVSQYQHTHPQAWIELELQRYARGNHTARRIL